MFGKFLKPKWQHAKVTVRRQALLDLDGSDGAAQVYIQVAREDEDAGIRGIAIKRLCDLGVLRHIMESDRDAGVQDLATRRYGRLLSGQESGIELSRRLQAVAGETSGEILNLIARQGVEVELRLAALERVSRESLLGDLAIEDQDSQVRLAAAQRLTQSSTMKRVARHSRSRDKQVYTLIQEQLDAMQEAREKPERLQKEARKICVGMETLAKARDPGATVAQQQGLDQHWRELQDEWHQGKCGEFPEELVHRFTQARDAWRAIYQQYLAEDDERREQEKFWSRIRQQRQELISQLRESLVQLPVEEPPALGPRRELLERVHQDWERLAPLPGTEQPVIAAQYREAREQLLSALTSVERREHLAEDLRRLQQGISRQSGAAHISVRKVEEFEQRCRQLDGGAASLFPQELKELRSSLDALRERLRRQEQRRQQDQDRYKVLVPLMEKQLAEGHTDKAFGALRELRAILRRMAKTDQQGLPAELQQRFSVAAAELDNIRDWKRWSGTSHKEELVEEAERLAGEVDNNPDARYDLDALASQVRALREEWKKLGETDHDVGEDLWQRFDSACSRAYAPCSDHFSQQEQERDSHRQHKEVICEGLETYYRDKLAGTDPDSVDWPAVEKIVQVARDEWRSAGVVNRKDNKALKKRFHDALDALRDGIKVQRKSGAEGKKQLIEDMQHLLDQAQGLAGDTPEFSQLLEDAKSLQARWKDVGPATGEHKLWKKFRALNDQLFGMRTAHLEAEKEAQEYNLQQKNELIAEIQALAQMPPEEYEVARRRYLDLRNNWKKVGMVPRTRVRELDKRFHRACKEFENGEERAARALQLRNMAILEDKAGLCAELETLLATGGGDVKTKVEEAQQHWQQLPSVDDELESVVARRFQKAVTAMLKLADGDQAAAERLLEGREAIPAQRLELCLRMELLADVDSPPDLQQQRMEYQLSHLAERMRGDNRSDDQEFLDILYRWYRLPVFEPDPDCLKRFVGSRDHFLKSN